MTTVHSRFYYNTSLPSPTNGWHCCLSEPKIILMPAEYNFLSFLIRETPVVFMHAAAGSKTAGLLYSLSLWYALSGQAACLDGSSWAVLQQVFTDRLGRDADVLCCGDLLIVFYKHMPVVQASRRYIPTAALWLAVLLGIQRQTINIVLLVFFFFFFSCDNLLWWLKNWWPNSLPCSSNVNILLINCIKALICSNNFGGEKSDCY